MSDFFVKCACSTCPNLSSCNFSTSLRCSFICSTRLIMPISEAYASRGCAFPEELPAFGCSARSRMRVSRQLSSSSCRPVCCLWRWCVDCDEVMLRPSSPSKSKSSGRFGETGFVESSRAVLAPLASIARCGCSTWCRSRDCSSCAAPMDEVSTASAPSAAPAAAPAAACTSGLAAASAAAAKEPSAAVCSRCWIHSCRS
mmetsp:Transcript_28197/g.38785  ORF Transcript_28197/g.38785 Transcript_28197/m.38785 type:complete len:200 (-) Transcript_28197:3167-3766(-)